MYIKENAALIKLNFCNDILAISYVQMYTREERLRREIYQQHL